MRMISLNALAGKLDLAESPVILDFRDADNFAAGHIPGSISIPNADIGAEELQLIVPKSDTVYLMMPEANHAMASEKIKKQFGPSDYAIIDGDFKAWRESGSKVDMIVTIDADELAMDLPYDEKILVIDFRAEISFTEGHVKDAMNIPLKELFDPGNLAHVEDAFNMYLYADTMSAAVTAASWLKRHGFHNLRVLAEGWEALKLHTGIPKGGEPEKLN